MMDISGLNKMQQEAVRRTDGPVLILAGAGSGKTRVLTHRIAYLLEEKRVRPYNIMAITFTNKAAKEMRERVDDLIGAGSEDIWVSTFHSSCVRMLRAHIDKIGYDRSFVIYDTDDQKKLMKDCLKELNMNEKNTTPRAVLSQISKAKDELITPKQFAAEAASTGDFQKEKTAKLYKLYQEKLVGNNALDFDDIIMLTVELLRTRPDVLERYQEKFKYIMVDEYQDTNTAQYKMIRLLASKYENLCVVGDDDQSIYKFRGANIRNILDFEKDFDNAFVVRLEQNYRCTKVILDAANQVIKNNMGRKAKTLWTDNEEGQLIKIHQADNERGEARFIADRVLEGVKDEMTYSQHAVLYRTNAQSRAIEESFMINNIPYKLVGGVAFYQRKEIKDILSYMRTIANSKDDMAVKRIINVPKRSIGATTVQKVDLLASNHQMDFFDVISNAMEFPTLGRAASKVFAFANFISSLRIQMDHMNLVKFVELVIKEVSYLDYIRKEYPEDHETRIENINELINKVAEYEERAEEPNMAELLEEIALVAAIDQVEDDDSVTLMTLHSAKGLEFPHVFIAGMEDGVFPSYMSIVSDDEDDVEEERRLAYVGITRAEKVLTISHARTRMVRGQTQYGKPSRFLEEIPEELLDQDEPNRMRPTFTANKPGGFQNPVVEQDLKRKLGGYGGATKRTNNTYSGHNTYMDRMRQQQPEKKSFGSFDEKTADFKKGDLVRHKKFGVGEVTNVEPGGADLQVTIQFMRAGEKKLLARLAGIKKIDD